MRGSGFVLEDWNMLFDAVLERLAAGPEPAQLRECLQALEQLQNEAAEAIVRLEAQAAARVRDELC